MRRADRPKAKLLPQYEADDGPLTAAQIRQIKKIIPQKPSRRTEVNLLFRMSSSQTPVKPPD